MPSSYTARLRLEKQAAGENLNTWGAPKLNTVFDRIDFAVAGMTTVALTGPHTLTSANTADDEARAALLKFTGALSAPAVVTLPAVSKKYLVWNAAGSVVTLTTGAGSAVSVDPGDKAAVFCDGAAVHELGYAGLGLKAYIAASALSATGSLPAAACNTGRYLFCDGAALSPRLPLTTDLIDLSAYTAQRTAQAIAFAVAL